jgi:hypothetical protein
VIGTVLVVGVAGGVVFYGVSKMVRQLRAHASKPLRPRQPWEYGGPS